MHLFLVLLYEKNAVALQLERGENGEDGESFLASPPPLLPGGGGWSGRAVVPDGVQLPAPGAVELPQGGAGGGGVGGSFAPPFPRRLRRGGSGLPPVGVRPVEESRIPRPAPFPGRLLRRGGAVGRVRSQGSSIL